VYSIIKPVIAITSVSPLTKSPNVLIVASLEQVVKGAPTKKSAHSVITDSGFQMASALRGCGVKSKKVKKKMKKKMIVMGMSDINNNSNLIQIFLIFSI